MSKLILKHTAVEGGHFHHLARVDSSLEDVTAELSRTVTTGPLGNVSIPAKDKKHVEEILKDQPDYFSKNQTYALWGEVKVFSVNITNAKNNRSLGIWDASINGLRKKEKKTS